MWPLRLVRRAGPCRACVAMLINLCCITIGEDWWRLVNIGEYWWILVNSEFVSTMLRLISYCVYSKTSLIPCLLLLLCIPDHLTLLWRNPWKSWFWINNEHQWIIFIEDFRCREFHYTRLLVCMVFMMVWYYLHTITCPMCLFATQLTRFAIHWHSVGRHPKACQQVLSGTMTCISIEWHGLSFQFWDLYDRKGPVDSLC